MTSLSPDFIKVVSYLSQNIKQNPKGLMSFMQLLSDWNKVSPQFAQKMLSKTAEKVSSSVGNSANLALLLASGILGNPELSDMLPDVTKNSIGFGGEM